MAEFIFRKATKDQEKLRMALDGPAGAGKTWTSLLLGTFLAEKEGGRVAVIDSERSSAKKYAREFDFDHLSLPDNDPRTYTAAIRAAIEQNYAVLIIDSLSHAWEGTLDMKDRVTRASSSKDSFGAWREVTPVHNDLVDTLLRAPAHVIATMRTATEYIVDPSNPDKTKRVQKVGLKPVQRAGVDYEFDVVGEMDQENTLLVTKTRCSALTGAVLYRPDEALARTLYDWLQDGEPVVSRTEAKSLLEALNAIPDEARKAAKAEFLENFGHPDAVLSSRLEDARAWVAARTGTPEAAGESESTEGKEASNTGSASSIEGEEGAPSTDEAPASSAPKGGGKSDTPKWAQDLHIYAGTVAKAVKLEDPEQLLDLVIYNVSGGKTTSARDLAQNLAGKVRTGLRDIEQCRTAVDVTEDGRYRLVAPSGELVGLPEREPAA